MSEATFCLGDQKESCLRTYPLFSVPKYICLSLPERTPPATVVRNRHRYFCLIYSRCTWTFWCHPCHILFFSVSDSKTEAEPLQSPSLSGPPAAFVSENQVRCFGSTFAVSVYVISLCALLHRLFHTPQQKTTPSTRQRCWRLVVTIFSSGTHVSVYEALSSSPASQWLLRWAIHRRRHLRYVCCLVTKIQLAWDDKNRDGSGTGNFVAFVSILFPRADAGIHSRRTKKGLVLSIRLAGAPWIPISTIQWVMNHIKVARTRCLTFCLWFNLESGGEGNGLGYRSRRESYGDAYSFHSSDLNINKYVRDWSANAKHARDRRGALLALALVLCSFRSHIFPPPTWPSYRCWFYLGGEYSYGRQPSKILSTRIASPEGRIFLCERRLRNGVLVPSLIEHLVVFLLLG